MNDKIQRYSLTESAAPNGIEGEVVDGKFVASSWPKPRFSNPNFLTGLLADMESDTKKEPTDE